MAKKPPPKKHRFKKGQSGNPKGKKKGTLNFKTRMIQLLSSIDKKGDWTNPIAAEYIKLIFAKSPDGEYLNPPRERLKALKEVMDRLEGTPVQNINEITDQNVHINLIDKSEKGI